MSDTTIRAGPATNLSPSRPPDDCTIVIFGVTGDLTQRKLIPALYTLGAQNELPRHLALIGTSTSVGSSDELRARLRESTTKFSGTRPLDEALWRSLADRVESVQADFNAPGAYRDLAARLAQVEARHGTRGNRLFYMATPPSVFPTILRHLKDAGLLHPPGPAPWSRVVMEKPFGRDLPSARELNRLIAEVLDESQIYRIDHYLGKETVQNLLVFRFANMFIESVWNRQSVDHVEISVAEKLGVEARAAYYEPTGALRDMVQNHITQLLTLIAMEP
ncbi:MAG TPA: glucose-6-phosphate dehydrogenase, partial [Planctomycetota bacterium]|nr:glucose-6-phosphate dehydrogenase [Planctomycetota bacterium]